MEIASILPLYAVLISALAAGLILITRRQPNVREFWTLAAAVIKFLLVASMFPLVSRGYIITFRLFEVIPDIACSFRVDPLGLYFALLASGLWIITSVYSIGYMRSLKEHEQTRYFASFALCLSATMGIAFAGDLFTFFIFYEILALATYPLVAHKETKEAILGGRKYLVYALTAGVLFLFAIAWTAKASGTLSFTPGGFLGSSLSPRALWVLFFLFIYGCGVKAALFPVHEWLPTAMVAPTPVSALLHAVAVVKAGVFGILRITGFVFGPELMRDSGLWFALACLAGFTILGASCIALTQENLKKRLAYSTISQLSYIVLGAALAAPAAYFGSILHMANHAMMKITLFFAAGSIYAHLHKEDIRDMKGIGRIMPWTMAAFTVGALGLSGLPPFCGLISKWFLCKGALQSGEWVFLAVFLSSALLNLAYLGPVILTAFGPNPDPLRGNERIKSLTLPLVLTALASILFGSVPFLISKQMQLAALAASSVFGGTP